MSISRRDHAIFADTHFLVRMITTRCNGLSLTTPNVHQANDRCFLCERMVVPEQVVLASSHLWPRFSLAQIKSETVLHRFRSVSLTDNTVSAPFEDIKYKMLCGDSGTQPHCEGTFSRWEKEFAQIFGTARKSSNGSIVADATKSSMVLFPYSLLWRTLYLTEATFKYVEIMEELRCALSVYRSAPESMEYQKLPEFALIMLPVAETAEHSSTSLNYFIQFTLIPPITFQGRWYLKWFHILFVFFMDEKAPPPPHFDRFIVKPNKDVNISSVTYGELPSEIKNFLETFGNPVYEIRDNMDESSRKKHEQVFKKRQATLQSVPRSIEILAMENQISDFLPHGVSFSSATKQFELPKSYTKLLQLIPVFRDQNGNAIDEAYLELAVETTHDRSLQPVVFFNYAQIDGKETQRVLFAAHLDRKRRWDNFSVLSPVGECTVDKLQTYLRVMFTDQKTGNTLTEWLQQFQEHWQQFLDEQ
eukprot:GILK01009577.1.p1 GENE.GILK01009577.1~~GILK01009577.1.p1  ORF type:complete len:475 (+),score=46.38 GILK01009577.1:559-1983(+)